MLTCDYNSLISTVSDIVVATAAAVAAWQGVRGLNTWRAETIGRRKAELAEDVLSDFYQMRETISAIRHPMSHPDIESKDRPKSEEETAEEARQKDSHYVPLSRLQKHDEFIGKFFAKKYRMRSYFGDTVEAPYEAINRALVRIRSASLGMIRSVQRGRKARDKLWHEWEQIIWEGWHDEKETDEIANSIDAAIQEMEKLCRPILEGRK